MANKTASIRYVEDKNGDVFFPVTHQRGVVDSDGNNLETALASKQDTLVSGTSIKTINGSSILGSGDIQVQTEITMDNVPTSGSNNPVKSGGLYTELAEKIGSQDIDNVVELTLAQYDALATKDARTMYIISDSTVESDHVGVASLVQTTTSTEDGGTNVWTCTLTNGQTFTLQVKNGNQGNSGYSGAAGELEVVNNVTDGGATAALSAEMGKQLEGEISQLGLEVEDINAELDPNGHRTYTLSLLRDLRVSDQGSGNMKITSNTNGYLYYAKVKSGAVINIAFSIASGAYYRRGFTTSLPALNVTGVGYTAKASSAVDDTYTAPSDGYIVVDCASGFNSLSMSSVISGDTIGKTVYSDNQKIEQLEADTYQQVTRSGDIIVGTAYTLTVGNAPSANSSSSYKAVIADNLKEGDQIAMVAKAGSSYASWAKLLNGVVVWASAAALAVDTTVVCDGTFDCIITNSYSSYVANPTITVTREESPREYTDRKIKKAIRILTIGNSFTEDSFSYLPSILKGLCPDIELTISIAYIGGSPVAQHYAYFSGQDVTLDGKKYTTESGQYKRINVSTSEVEWSGLYTVYTSINGGSWNAGESMTVQQMLDKAEWDIITFQQSGGTSNGDWATYYAPYLFPLQKELYSKIDYPTRLGWVLIHGAYGESDAAFLSKWEGTALNAEKVMDETGASILFPYGTAIQNLRTTTLKSLGDGTAHNLTVDNAHLQEGVGPLAAAYTNAIVIMRSLGFAFGVIGEQTRPDATFLTRNSIPGQNVGTGIIGITDANCFLAQVAAEKAVMNPYELTDLSVYQ